MQYVYIVCELIAGLGAFLIGVKLLSDNMEKLAASRFKDFFHRKPKTVPVITAAETQGMTDEEREAFLKKTRRAAKRKDIAAEIGSRLAGVGIGTASTAIVQSSSLTTVMVVGLVNAGVMSLSYATTIIMGANIGTTVTGLIAALQEFDVATFATALAGIGIFAAIFAKKEKAVSVSLAIAGLGLVFVGLGIMADSMTAVRESEAVTNAFASIDNPFLLFFLGIAVTGIVQSSSAVTSILISMAAAGITIGSGGNSVMFVVLGTNIGEILTVLVAMLLWGVSPLLSMQLLWINLVTDSLPAIALGMEPVEKDIMTKKPKPKNPGLLKFINHRPIKYVAARDENGVEVWGLISNLENADVDTTQVLNVTSSRDTLVNNLVAEAVKYDLDGINVDFEMLDPEDAAGFLQFIREQRQKFWLIRLQLR